MAKKTVRKIIDDRGGAAAVAAALTTPERKVPKTTVRSWCDANRLPWWREDAVMALPVVAKVPRKRDATAQQASAA
jgi:hypothetical protein